MALFRRSINKEIDALASGPPLDPNWAEHPDGGFHSFTEMDPEELGLKKASGVFVLWHGGLRPEWVYVARSDNISKALYALADNDDIMSYDQPNKLSVTWALVRREYQDGVIKYLTTMLDPLVDNPTDVKSDVKPIPVLPPGVKQEKD